MRYQLIILFVCALPACGGGGKPVPEFMTVEELALVYDRTIGNEVILEGRLNRDVNGKYSLSQLPTSAADNHEEGLRVHLSFINDNVNHDLMKPCVGDATIVTGHIEDAYTIRAKWVKRTADARIHKHVSCYVHDQ